MRERESFVRGERMFNFIFRVERWKWNDEYEMYVSTEGHFKDKKKRPIPIKIDQGGYVKVQIPGGKHKYAHRLVMMTWKPTVNMENLTVDHLDHNKRYNALSNLEWVSLEENQRRAVEDYLNKPEENVVEKPVVVKEKKINKHDIIIKQVEEAIAKNEFLGMTPKMKNKSTFYPCVLYNNLVRDDPNLVQIFNTYEEFDSWFRRNNRGVKKTRKGLLENYRDALNKKSCGFSALGLDIKDGWRLAIKCNYKPYKKIEEEINKKLGRI